MNNEMSLSEMSKADLLKLRDELTADKKREEVELSRLNAEYRKYGRSMSQDTYNATVTMQQDCKTRLAYITERLIEVKDALRAIADYESETRNKSESFKSMTLRDYFAAKAMQGMLSTGAIDQPQFERLSVKCYMLADAMLKAR